MVRHFIIDIAIATYTVIIIFSSEIHGGLVCDNNPRVPGPSAPALPKFYSTRIQLNDDTTTATYEIQRIVDTTKKSDSIELWSSSTHIKYINIENSLLTLKYTDKSITCTTRDSSKLNRRSTYLVDGAKPLDIIDVLERILSDTESFSDAGFALINGVAVQQWVFCDDVKDLNAEVKIVVSFADPKWKPFYSGLKPNEYEIIQIEVDGLTKSNEEMHLLLNFFNYTPFQPEETSFQVPEQVHCPNYRSNKAIPDLPIYFSYQSEEMHHVNPAGAAPAVIHNEVHYDTKAGLARLRFQKPGDKNLNVVETEIIYDFNLGIQYSTDPLTGGCVMALYDHTFDVLSYIKTSTNSVLDAKTFFNLDGASLSYAGKFEARGIASDVFSGAVTRSGNKRENFWYFEADKVDIIEGQVIEKNVLLKMISRPVPANGKEDQIEINFYNFKHREPNMELFDISACFNESQSKSFSISFLVKREMFVKESHSSLKLVIHQAIQKVADVSRQRIVIHEVYFEGNYLYVVFTVLDIPPIRGQKPAPKESVLQTAINKLRETINKRDFKVTFRTSSQKETTLVAETGGLKELIIRKKAAADAPTYKEGSVIGVAVGMTLLGFLLGAVVINLVISRKYGVSLFQKSGFLGKGARAFQNPLNESAI